MMVDANVWETAGIVALREGGHDCDSMRGKLVDGSFGVYVSRGSMRMQLVPFVQLGAACDGFKISGRFVIC